MHLARILPMLQSAEIRPRVITLTHKGELAHKLESAGIVVCQPPDFIRFLNRLPVIKLLLGIPLTFIYLLWSFVSSPARLSFFYLPASYLLGSLAVILSGQSGKTVMFRRSMNAYQHKRPVAGWIERQLHKHQAMIVANSQAIQQELTVSEGVPKSRLRLIYNGVDVSRYGQSSDRAQARAELGIAESALVLCYVANLLPYKGHADLMQALALASERLPQGWLLLCVGAGLDSRLDLAEMVSKYQLQDHVIWLGQRNDVARIQSAVDIGLHVSHQEGFSNAVLEGMASGLPMIVTDVGGNGEAIEDRVSGVLIKPHSVTELAEAILQLCQHPAQARQYGAAARARVATVFSLQATVDGYRELIAELCS
jgi:glycosyltransferase involved in cell wall biosynthesis